MSEGQYEAAGTHEPTGVKTPKKAALASWIGSALEYYDFFIYGTAAALVFNKVFFPASSPATGTLLALATFGVGRAGGRQFDDARACTAGEARVLHQLHAVGHAGGSSSSARSFQAS